MRTCQHGDNKGRVYVACANRAESCRGAFMFLDTLGTARNAKTSENSQGSESAAEAQSAPAAMQLVARTNNSKVAMRAHSGPPAYTHGSMR